MLHIQSSLGVTLLKVIASFAIVAALTAIAIPYYQHYTRKIYFNEIVQAAKPYVVAVTQCYEEQGTLSVCNAGTNDIPPAMTTSKGVVASISVASGVIVVKPVPKHGIDAADTLVMTPTISGITVSWDISGIGVKLRLL